MTALAIEIHDAGLLTVDENGTQGDERPGYALYDAGGVVTGQPALDRAREKPRSIHHLFWQELDTQPLGQPFPGQLSAADLAHAQLSDAWQAAPAGIDSVLMAIPGCFSSRQLGLALGIARACRVPVTGMVDSAVAAATVGAAEAAAHASKILHLDLHLHRVVLTELELSLSPAAAGPRTARIVRRAGEVGDGLGQIALQDAWARRVADLFVQATRFDPLYSAATEQALYSRLPDWLEALSEEQIVEVEMGLPGAGTLELTRADVVGAADAFYESYIALLLSHKRAGEPVTVLLSHRMARLPGLERRLGALRGVAAVALPPASAALGVLANREEIESAGAHNTDRQDDQPASGSLPFVTRLSFSVSAKVAAASTTAAAPVVHPPSHVLFEGLAYAITEEPFWLGSTSNGQHGLVVGAGSGEISPAHCVIRGSADGVELVDHSSQGCSLNGERIAERARLAAGDRLELGSSGIEIQLIAVVDGDGAA